MIDSAALTVGTPTPLSRGLMMFGIVGIVVLAEYAYAKLSHHDEHHDGRETAASLGVAAGDLIIRALGASVVAVPFLALYERRVFDIDLGMPWAWALLFVGVEFCYYWFHRASHRVRWLWATHAVHHSATHFNLSAAVRLGWTGQATGAFVFFLPLAWIGFHPLAIGAVMAAGLLYQFFLHTSADVSLGPLEWVLNSPRHHRVHHASNDACLDVNYGSVLIVFDRLFGTFAAAPAGERLRYGLKGRDCTRNVFRIALGEWVHLYRDVQVAPTWRRRLAVLFGPP
jgi:sterol desaturase/sphingolipid hydroxylase (fatty acid hydroxylase superfamily)